jgi:hypothetical protein
VLAQPELVNRSTRSAGEVTDYHQGLEGRRQDVGLVLMKKRPASAGFFMPAFCAAQATGAMRLAQWRAIHHADAFTGQGFEPWR